MYFHKTRSITIYLFIALFSIQLQAQQVDHGTSAIKATIHKNAAFIKQKWKQHRYFLFAAKGNRISNTIGVQRSFLIDNQTGNCRLESVNPQNQEIIVLFNFKTKKLMRQYIQGKETNSNSTQLLQATLDQFFEDSKLLFLPILLTDQSANFSTVSSKIINAEKINSISFSNLQTIDNESMSGKIGLNTKGEIKIFSEGESEYLVQNYKDIGSGIILPTEYKNLKNTAQSCNFTTVAAFTEIEAGKFTSL